MLLILCIIFIVISTIFSIGCLIFTIKSFLDKEIFQGIAFAISFILVLSLSYVNFTFFLRTIEMEKYYNNNKKMEKILNDQKM
jgi:hypothetical protein